MANILGEGLAPEDAIKYWKSKVLMTDAEAKKLSDGAKSRAFYVSGLAEHDQVALVHKALLSALENGETLQDFKKNIGSVIKSKGWHKHRIENIYRTNMQTAYAAGSWAQIQKTKATRPYLQYICIIDRRTRPQHAVLNGLVFHIDDSFWDSHYPPNGYRCRCGKRTLSERQVSKNKLTIEQGTPNGLMYTDPKTGMEYFVNLPGADKGFAQNVGKDWLAGVNLEKYPTLTDKSYEEQRGIKSQISPVKNDAELCNAIKEKCAQFATNAGISEVSIEKASYFLATNCKGKIWISNKTHNNQFNAKESIFSAWNKIAKREQLTWNEEYSLEGLWHEIIHNQQKFGSLGRGDTVKRRTMEIVTQWTARRSYPKLISSLGGTATYQKDVIKNGLGYSGMIKNFDRLLEVLKVKDSDLLPQMEQWIKNEGRDTYGNLLTKYLSEKSNKPKSSIKKAISRTNDRNYEEILRDLALI